MITYVLLMIIKTHMLSVDGACCKNVNLLLL